VSYTAPPGVNPIAVKYIYHIILYHIILYRILSYHIILYIISCNQWRTQEFFSRGGFRQEFFRGGGGQQIQLTTEDRENGDLGAVAPYSGVPLNLQMSETRIVIRLLRIYFPRISEFGSASEFRGGGGV
jgi:hypothetical protein